MIIGNLKSEAYFQVLYSFSVVESLRNLKVHHCLSLITISNSGCDLLYHHTKYAPSRIDFSGKTVGLFIVLEGLN